MVTTVTAMPYLYETQRLLEFNSTEEYDQLYFIEIKNVRAGVGFYGDVLSCTKVFVTAASVNATIRSIELMYVTADFGLYSDVLSHAKVLITAASINATSRSFSILE